MAAKIRDNPTEAKQRTSASAATESTADGSAAVFTPRSNSTTSFSLEPVNGSRSEFRGRQETDEPTGYFADRAILSIEHNSDSTFNEYYISTPQHSITHTSESPSPVLDVKGKGVLREGLGKDDIGSRLQNLRISSSESKLGLSDTAGEARGTVNQDLLLGSGYRNPEKNFL
jgi:hypothetical protein